MRSITLCLLLLPLCFVMTGGISSAQSAPSADIVVLNANVLTVSPKQPKAQAFAIRGDKFLAVGTEAQVRAFIGSGTQVWDLKGKTVVPGFNDAHLHPMAIFPEDSPFAEVDLSPAKAKTMDDLIAALKHKAEITPKGQWVLGMSYQDTKLGRHPTRADLDKASTEHPIYISHSSGHVGACNSLALKQAGITRDTPEPPGGTFGRDANGEPNGFVGESAQSIIRKAGPAIPQPTASEEQDGYAECFRRFVAKGITSAGIAGTDTRMVETLRTMKAQGRLPLRFNVMLREKDIPTLGATVQAGDRGDDWIHVASIKIFHGNSFSGRTCWCSEPYLSRPNYFGIPPARTQAELDALIASVHNAGLQACVHSNGDREISMVLEAIEKAQRANPRPDARHRIEHCSVVTQPILDRIKRLGVVIVPHSYEWEHGDKLLDYGPKRLDWLMPNGSGVRMGIAVAGHSDYPVSAADPLLRLQSMITRTTAEGTVIGRKQSVTPEQALRIWTLGSAVSEFEEKRKGSIEAGKLADFVVLEADPTHTPHDHIRKIAVERTVVGGRSVYP